MTKLLNLNILTKRILLIFVIALVLAAAVLSVSLVDRVKNIYAGVGTSPRIMPSVSAAATDMFLKIPGIEGESKDSSHKNEIDVLSWGWEMSQSGTSPTGTGRGGGKANVQDLSLVKYVDKASTDLMMHCCGGKHIPEAKLTVRKAGEKPMEYLIVTMTDVVVTSVSTGGSSNDDRLTENITLNFKSVKVEYQEYDGNGNPKGPPKEFKWSKSEARNF